METIWKFELPLQTTIKLNLPKGAKFAAVQVQHDTVCVWYQVNPQNPIKERPLYLVGTGLTVPEGTTYLGTVQLNDGHLVLHVFENNKNV